MKKILFSLLFSLLCILVTGCSSDNYFTTSHQYNFYINSGTLPTLYSALNMAKFYNQYSYVWFEREGTLNIEMLEKNKYINLSKFLYDNENQDSIVAEVKDQISKILKKDKNAYFNLFIDDEKYFMEFEIFTSLDIPETMYSVNYISNGTISYFTKYIYQNENGFMFYKNFLNKINDIKEDYRTNGKSDFVHVMDYIIPLSNRSNAKYYLQYPNYLTAENENIKEIYNQINFVSESPFDLYNKLSDYQKKIFLQYISLDKNQYDEKYFHKKGDYLVITGSNPLEYGYTEEEFKNIILQIKEKYKQYNIIFKPHPKAYPDDNYIEFFKKNDIEVLPSSIPMETIYFIYPNLKIGGFVSSLYMSVPKDNVLFFIAEDKDKLFVPISYMCVDVFENIEFIQPNL